MHFVEPESSFLCLQDPSTDPYTELYESSPQSSILFLQAHFNIIHISMPSSSGLVSLSRIVNGHPFSPMHAPCLAHPICPELMRKIFQHMNFQSITLTALIKPHPPKKICLADIFESRELRSKHYDQHFLTKFLKIYPLVQNLFGHTYYIHIIPTFIYMQTYISGLERLQALITGNKRFWISLCVLG